jgi:hypothetical protein
VLLLCTIVAVSLAVAGCGDGAQQQHRDLPP